MNCRYLILLFDNYLNTKKYQLPILPPSNLIVYNGIFSKHFKDSGAFIISLEGLNMVKLKFGLNKFSNMFGLHY